MARNQHKINLSWSCSPLFVAIHNLFTFNFLSTFLLAFYRGTFIVASVL
jgi:hypothetical protein